MLWNRKRTDFQVYKEKKDNSFLIAFPDKRDVKNCMAFCGLIEKPSPNYYNFCHSQVSYDFLRSECYEVSQAKLRKYPEWYKFFETYLKDVL